MGMILMSACILYVFSLMRDYKMRNCQANIQETDKSWYVERCIITTSNYIT